MKKGLSSYTEANNARDVIAMLYLLSFLHLEDYHVTKVHSTVTDTAILRIKMSSHPPVNSLTAIRVPAGTKNSRPVGFLR